MRVVLVTGKGGVGKTTVAAATAVQASTAHGLRTLVLSTDAAHSLGDVLGSSLGHELTRIGPRLCAQQLDGRRRFEESWGEIREYLVDLLGWAGADAIDAAELAALPGLDEILALENLRGHAQRDDLDLIVVDCAPTAETLRLLALPDVLGWYLDRVFPTHRRIARVSRPFLRRTTSMPLAGDELFDSLTRFTERLDGVRNLLRDADTTRIRLVTTTEQVVVAETRRTYAYLALYGYSVDALVANRLLGDAHQGPFFDEWRTRQHAGLTSIDETFSSITQLEAPLEAVDLVGPDRLALLGKELYADVDPSRRLSPAGRGLSFDRDGDRVVLRLPLPGADPDTVQVGRTDLDLLVTAGAHRRIIPLPDALRTWRGQAARFEGDELHVAFVEA